jgi:2-polyprenyl-3-methyl-5-hydroxy-6-metoxy-1,4-benzoquinol methylase
MLRFIKEKLYFLKRWYFIIFAYPQEHLTGDESLDYDVYWKEKRGRIDGHQARAISPNERMRAEYVASVIGTEAVSVGDIASGPGVIFNFLKTKLQLKEYIGYEYSDYALSVAQSLGMQGVKFDIHSDSDIEVIQEADYFLMLEILEHIPHAEKVLAQIYKKAHKGVFFSFPNSGNFLYRLRVLFGRMPAQWVKFPNEHLRFWTLADLKWWLKALGYTNYEIHCYRGIPILERIWPALFAGSFVVFLSKVKEL